jgi:hypothetical protein
MGPQNLNPAKNNIPYGVVGYSQWILERAPGEMPELDQDILNAFSLCSLYDSKLKPAFLTGIAENH